MPMQISIQSLSSCLNRPANEKTLANALHLHSYISRAGLEGHNLIGNLLVYMLSEMGLSCQAQNVFGKLAVKTESSWSFLINALLKVGDSNQAFSLYKSMAENSLQLNDPTYVAMLNSCGRLKDVERGNELYAEIASKGLMMTNRFIGNALVDMYAKCDLLVKAKEVFDKLPTRDVVTWTALIAGYAQHNHGEDALKCYEQMQLAGIQPNVVTYTCALKACGSISALEKGKEIHFQIEGDGLLKKNCIIGNALVNMYIKCGNLTKAQEVFDGLDVHDVTAWNTLICGYVQHEIALQALDCYEQMQVEGVPSDATTFTSVLKACALIKAKAKGEEIHDELRQNGLLCMNHFVGNALVDMYAKCGALKKAQEVFDELLVHHLVAWNSLIVGYTEHNLGGEALRCFREMQEERIPPDGITVIHVMKAYGSMGYYIQGIRIHTHFEQKGLFGHDPSLSSQLIDIYAKWGYLDKAQEEFDKLPVRDEVSWTALIAGYAQHEYDNEVLVCFERMQADGILPDSVTFSCVLKACGSIGLAGKGQELHAEIVRTGMNKAENYLGNALVHLYAKSGMVMQAQEVFDSMSFHDVIAWTALITGYAQKADIKNVLWTFNKMKEGGSPNSITFISVISACSHAGLVESGQAYFVVMIRSYNISPSFDHYNCIIDLLGRAGQLDKALATMEQIPSYDDIIMWRTLLGACRKWHDVLLARQAYEQAVRLDDNEVASHLSMYNIYADAGLLEDIDAQN